MDPQIVAIPAYLVLLALAVARAGCVCGAVAYLFRAPGWRPRGEGATATDLERTAGLAA
jgi:hypothetical protein